MKFFVICENKKIQHCWQQSLGKKINKIKLALEQKSTIVFIMTLFKQAYTHIQNCWVTDMNKEKRKTAHFDYLLSFSVVIVFDVNMS